MATPIIMPKQGQSVETCVIVGWKKRPGDAVKAGEVVCEVETDKATFEVESPAEGTLLAVFFEAGSDVPVLTPIAAIGKAGENVDSLRKGAPSQGTSAASAAAAVPSSTAAPSAAAAVAASITAAAGRIMASPRAKALAETRGVSLAGLRGTGPAGRIIERDVQDALARGLPGAATTQETPRSGAARAAATGMPRSTVAAVPMAAGEVKEIKVTGVRKLIAERMLASISTTAQLTLHSAADARSMQELRRKFKGSGESLGLRDVTINDMVLFAVSRALAAHPDLNATFTGDTIRQFADVHLGFAVDTPKGLMVPVIRNAGRRSLREIAAESARLADGCRNGGITPDEMSGGTFTVTNLGSLGVQGFTPVLNVPQVGILGVGAIVPGPVTAADGSVQFIPQIGLSLTINHQVVDGAPGARFLQTLAEDMAKFDLLLAR
jgi:pyruvate dehydrogenase E2 component (dihydrolipoamide acetyltransferase)